MTTNGYFLTPDVVKELFRYRVIDYQITIDGIESTHNALRKLKTKDDGTYQVILNNLKAIKSQIKSSILTLTIQTNYTKDICPKLTRAYTVRTGPFPRPAVLLFAPRTSSTRRSSALQGAETATV